MRILFYKFHKILKLLSVIALFGLALSTVLLPEVQLRAWNSWIKTHCPPPFVLDGPSDYMLSWILILFVFTFVYLLSTASSFRDLERAEVLTAYATKEKRADAVKSIPFLGVLLNVVYVFLQTRHLYKALLAAPEGYLMTKRFLEPKLQQIEAVMDDLTGLGLTARGDSSSFTPFYFCAEGLLNGVRVNVEKENLSSMRKRPDGTETDVTFVTTVETGIKYIQFTVRVSSEEHAGEPTPGDAEVVYLDIKSPDLPKAKDWIKNHIDMLSPILDKYVYLSLNMPYKKFRTPFTDSPYMVAVGYEVSKENLVSLADLSRRLRSE